MTLAPLEAITELEGELSSSTNAAELAERIGSRLASLREIFVSRRRCFTPEVVATLQRLASLHDVLLELVEKLDEVDGLCTQEDAEDLSVDFDDLAERLRPYPVAQRAEKERRELAERYAKLPSAAVAQRDAESHRRYVRLQASAPSCRRCQSAMVLRESARGLFWGCSTFPRCFGRAAVTPAERAS